MEKPFRFLHLPAKAMAKIILDIDPVEIIILAMKYRALRRAMNDRKMKFKIKSLKWVLSEESIASMVIEVEGTKIYIKIDADENYLGNQQNRTEQLPLNSVSLEHIPDNDRSWHLRVNNVSEAVANGGEQADPGRCVDLQMRDINGIHNLSKMQRLEVFSKVFMTVSDVEYYYLATFVSNKLDLLEFFNWNVTAENYTWQTPRVFWEVQFFPSRTADRRQLQREFAFVQRNVTVEYNQLLVPVGVQSIKFGEPLTARVSIIVDTDFITMKSVLNSTSEGIHFVTSLNGYFLNAIIRKWISGGLNNLKIFTGQTFNSFTNREHVFDKLHPIAPTSSAHPKFESTDGDWENAKDVFRARGSMRASIVLEENHFKFLVW